METTVIIPLLASALGFVSGIAVKGFIFDNKLSNKITEVCTNLNNFANLLNTHINSPPRECLIHNETTSKLSEHDKQIAVLKERIIKNEQRE